MATLLCECGKSWQAEPPDDCPRCGMTITRPATPLRFDPVETMGWTTTDDEQATGAAW